MEIICDTNIWYNLGGGSIDIGLFQGHELLATRLNIDELCTTENLLDPDNAIKIRNACKALFSYAKNIEKLGPLDFILDHSGNSMNHLHPNYEEKVNKNIESLEKISSMSVSELSKLITNEKFQSAIKSWDDPLVQGANYVNQTLDNLRALKLDKKAYRNFDNTDMIIEFVEELYKISGFDVDRLNVIWDKFDLFVQSIRLYFLELELSKSRFKKNDWVDLFNLAYVTDERMYCTLDNKGVHRVIKSNDRLSSRLFKIIDL